MVRYVYTCIGGLVHTSHIVAAEDTEPTDALRNRRAICGAPSAIASLLATRWHVIESAPEAMTSNNHKRLCRRCYETCMAQLTNAIAADVQRQMELVAVAASQALQMEDLKRRHAVHHDRYCDVGLESDVTRWPYSMEPF